MKRFLNPIRLIALWIGITIVANIIVVPILFRTTSGGEQAPFSFIAGSLYMTFFGILLITIFSVIFQRKWLRRYWYALLPFTIISLVSIISHLMMIRENVFDNVKETKTVGSSTLKLTREDYLRNQACYAAKMAKSNVPVSDSLWRVIKSGSSDTCVLILLDTLVNRVIQTNSEAPLVSLNNIGKSSDGYISEYLLEVGDKLFYEDFADVFKFISKYPDQSKEGLQANIVETLSKRVGESDNREMEKRKIEQFASRQIKKHSLDSTIAQKVHDILLRIEPEMFD